MTERASTQSRVLACIRKYPGIHLRAIERELGLSSALVHYHVKGLEAGGLIVSAPVGGYLRFYPKEAVEGRRGLTADDQELLAFLREEVPLHVVLILLERGPTTQADIGEDLGLAKSTVSYHVDKLVTRGLLERQERGQEKVLRVRDAGRVRRLLAHYEPTVDLQEKFRGLWEDFYGG